ncbi:signal transduction histidine kinase [Pseudonocardia sediminis]|uniref:histidine kinase n=1 Tax=Pseudonocardia sediminis TaxID=1397368 RepID=A0A4Q7UUH1_PSEST|nr:signal transduction histidine kinase [Pseudonocardia sediminis]
MVPAARSLPSTRGPGLLPPGRRTARDLGVDVAVFVVACAVAVAEYPLTVAADHYGLPEWIRTAEPFLAAVACLSLWWRRRFPTALGLLAAGLLAVSNLALGAALVLLFSLALHRGWRHAVPVTALAWLLSVPYVVLYFPGTIGDPLLWTVLLGLMLALVATAGLAVRARRELVLSLRRHAENLARTHVRDLADARRDERARIAREMHDVLAHRISLLSVHAGALEYRSAAAADGTAAALPPGELRDAAAVVRDNAHRALEDLQEVLHVLRDPASGDESWSPPPSADRLPALLAEARSGGQPVRDDLADAVHELPEVLQRSVYRIVQEGLTNARKHAPGAEVRVRVGGGHGDELVVEIVNAVPVGVTGREIPGAGTGLTGVAERVTLHGGTLTHGVDAGRFRLVARIPWPA